MLRKYKDNFTVNIKHKNIIIGAYLYKLCIHINY